MKKLYESFNIFIILSYFMFITMIFIINSLPQIYLLTGSILGYQIYLIPSLMTIGVLSYYNFVISISDIEYIIIGSIIILYCIIEFLFGVILINISTVSLTVIFGSNMILTGLLSLIYYHVILPYNIYAFK